jgi:hypothetical protein
MFKKITQSALLASALLLSACGAPTDNQTSTITQSVATADANTILVARKTGFGGSFVPINIFVDGTRVGSVGNNKVETIAIPSGEHEIEVRFTGPAAITTQPATLSFNKSATSPAYFNISLRSGLIGASLQIAEVSANSLAQ